MSYVSRLKSSVIHLFLPRIKKTKTLENTNFCFAWRAPKNWRGGIKLDENKNQTNNIAIKRLLPGNSRFNVPIGPTNQTHNIIVEIGQFVFKGDTLVQGNTNTISVHAPTSGVVTGIYEQLVCGYELPQLSLQIRSDGLDTWGEKIKFSNTSPSKLDLANFLMERGIVGLGGAGFPTGKKLSTTGELEYLLINGVECEPYITSDDRLMQERSKDLILGIAALAKLLNIKKIQIGIECNKQHAIKKLRESVYQLQQRIEVVEIPTFYPAGSQTQLIQSLTGKTLPFGKHASDFGIVVMNVATAYAAGRAILHGEPLISRIVTLTGDVKTPCNLEVPIGTDLRNLIKKASPNHKKFKIMVGGPMMGKLLPTIDAVIGKTTSCLIIQDDTNIINTKEEQPCIRCARCVDACPSNLEPARLYEACKSNKPSALQELKINACIECGACSYVCPSNIPLRDTFRISKKK